MIIGAYPCCNGAMMFTIPAGVRLPTYFKEECEWCNATVWHRVSRVDPKSWIEGDFLKHYNVDPIIKTITDKNPPQPIDTALAEVISKVLGKHLADAIDSLFFVGTAGHGEPKGILGLNEKEIK